MRPLGLSMTMRSRVLVDDRERHGLRLGLGRLGRRHAHDVGVAGLHAAAHVQHHHAVAGDGAGADQGLQARAAEAPAAAAARKRSRRSPAASAAVSTSCRSSGSPAMARAGSRGAPECPALIACRRHL